MFFEGTREKVIERKKERCGASSIGFIPHEPPWVMGKERRDSWIFVAQSKENHKNAFFDVSHVFRDI
jgi:hypothetical protein